MERKNSTLKDSEIPLQMSCSPISKTADIQSAELPVCWIGDSCEGKVGDVRFTSVVIFRVQIFCLARSILQISFVSTEQSRIGVMN